MYLNTKYFQQIYLNTKHIDVFQYFSKYHQNIDLLNPLTFLKLIIYQTEYLVQLSRISMS